MSSLEYLNFGMKLYRFFASCEGPVVEPLIPAPPIFPTVFEVLVEVLLNLDRYGPVT